MKSTIGIAGVAVIAFIAGLAASFFLLPLWVMTAINIARDGNRTDWLGFAGGLLGNLLTALVAAGAIYFAWRGIMQQIAIAKDSVDAAAASNQFNKEVFDATQRPWVSIVNVPIARDLQSGFLRLSVDIKNSGTLPASRVRVVPNAYFFGRGRTVPSIERDAMMNDLGSRAGREPGQVLFPGVQVSLEIDCPVGHPLFNPLSDAPRPPQDVLFVILCIDYEFMSSGERHQTGSVFMVRRMVADGTFEPIAGNVPANELQITWHPTMGTAAN
jgi:hypothetical protein